MKNKAILLTTVGVLLLSSLLLASCGESAQVPKNEEKQTQAVTEAGTDYSDPVAVQFSGHDYGEYNFRILAMDPGKHFYQKIAPDANEVYYETDSADILNSAIYKRNMMTEELLNIKITPVWGGERTEICPMASKIILAGDDAFDCMLAPLYNSMPLAVEHQLEDLNSIETLQTGSPWWDQDIIENYTVNDKLFMLTGHYSIFDDYAVPVVFINRKVVANMEFESPYDIVRDGRWTLEYMMRNAEAFTKDLNGDGKLKVDDQWGYLDNGDCYAHLAGGMGFTYAEKDADGVYRIALGSEFVLKTMEYLYNNVVLSEAILKTDNSSAVVSFKEDRCLYYYELLGAINELRDMEADFAVAPVPKYEEAQDRYYCPLQTQWCTGLAVPVTQPDPNRTGVVMDVLGAYSTDTVQMTLFELLLGEKLVRDAESVEMLDIAFRSKLYDLADLPCETIIYRLFNGMSKKSGFVFASKYEKQRETLDRQLADFLAAFEDE